MFWLLNRLKKPLAIWLCFPAAVALFVALLPALRAALAGARSNLFVASLVERFPSEEQARVRAVGVIFSRGREQHTLAFPGVKGSAMVGLRSPSPILLHAKSDEDGVVVDPLRVDMWGRETFELEGMTTHAPEVTGRCIDLGGGRMKLKITNAGKGILPAGMFVYSSGGMWDGCPTRLLGPGRTYEREVLLTNNMAVESFPWPAFFRGARWRDFWPPGAAAAFVVCDRYSQNADAAQRTLDLFDQPSALSGLAWPTPHSDRYLETKVDCRTLVVWLPVDRAAPRSEVISYGRVRPRIYATPDKSGPFKDGSISEFQFFDEPGVKVYGLSVRVKYYELKKSYRLQIYNYAERRWEDVKFPHKGKPFGRQHRWERKVYFREAMILLHPQHYFSQSTGVVALRENLPPPSPQRYGAYYRYGRYRRYAIAGGARDRWVEVEATVERPATR